MLRLALSVERQDGTVARKNIAAIVDSGAATSYFALDVAEELGIRSDLTEAGSGGGLGSSFQIWKAPRPVRAQVVALYPEPQGATLIGPVVNLHPSFGDPQDSLLGRADFFRAFQISFRESATPPLLTLAW